MSDIVSMSITSTNHADAPCHTSQPIQPTQAIAARSTTRQNKYGIIPPAPGLARPILHPRLLHRVLSSNFLKTLQRNPIDAFCKKSICLQKRFEHHSIYLFSTSTTPALSAVHSSSAGGGARHSMLLWHQKCGGANSPDKGNSSTQPAQGLCLHPVLPRTPGTASAFQACFLPVISKDIFYPGEPWAGKVHISIFDTVFHEAPILIAPDKHPFIP